MTQAVENQATGDRHRRRGERNVAAKRSSRDIHARQDQSASIGLPPYT
jgi:hypothetical protein